MRLLFCTICLLCLAFSANAQVSLGVSGGANMTYWKWKIKAFNYDLDFDPALGWRSAVVADWRLTSVLGLRAELGYQVLSNRKELTFTTPNDPEGESGALLRALPLLDEQPAGRHHPVSEQKNVFSGRHFGSADCCRLEQGERGSTRTRCTETLEN
ncbi:MAG: hypothetical protein IPM98_17655 [Lewinellaceae bacterium]|nr:hypothetical protein [Lewinellaceae bacterium]